MYNSYYFNNRYNGTNRMRRNILFYNNFYSSRNTNQITTFNPISNLKNTFKKTFDNFENKNQDFKEESEENEDKNISNMNTNPIIGLGPIEIFNDRISFFGNIFKNDDLIIMAVVAFLLFEKNNDYTLLIILGLILFDIKLSNITDILPIKNLQSLF